MTICVLYFVENPIDKERDPGINAHWIITFPAFLAIDNNAK